MIQNLKSGYQHRLTHSHFAHTLSHFRPCDSCTASVKALPKARYINSLNNDVNTELVSLVTLVSSWLGMGA